MKKGKTHGLARVFLASLMCIIIVLANIFIIIPVKTQGQIQYSVVTKEKTIEDLKRETEYNEEITLAQARNMISSRGLTKRRQKYTLYKFLINNSEVFYTDDLGIAEEYKQYILNNTINLKIDIEEFITEDNSVLATDREMDNIAEYYVNTYKKPTTHFPTNSHNVSSSYGYRSRGDFHTGIDLCGNKGDNIYAYKSGTVIKTQYSNRSYGNMILLQHSDGTQTRYAHLSSIVVSNGQYVNCGQVIGYMGSTGNSTGNHLHFEIIVNGNTINPYNYIF